MKNILLVTLLSMLGAVAGQAQPSWQWGKRGGGSFNENTIGGQYEEVVDVAADPKGNIYVLSQAFANANDINVDGNPILGRGARDVVLSSFRCDGTHRWTKLFGANQSDVPRAVETDSLGGVYVTGSMFHTSASGYFGSDTTLGPSQKTFWIVKYDTAGAYKWLRRPQPDTATALNNPTGSWDMEVSNSGDVFVLASLRAGLYANGSFNAVGDGMYLLQYDRNGVFVSGTQMAITASIFPSYWRKLWMKRNHSNGKLYVGGYGTGSGGGALSFGATAITNTMFIGSFSPAGGIGWVRQNTLTGPFGINASLAKPVLDGAGNLLMGGNSQHGDVFLGVTITNTYSTQAHRVALALKMDTAGSVVWLRNSSNTANVIGDGASTLFNGNELIIADGYSSKVRWPGFADTIAKTSSADFDFFTTRFDAATGSVIKIDTLSSGTSVSNNYPKAMTADKSGNAYIGGAFQSNVVVNGMTLTSAGGYRDFFVAKYGASNCGCTVPAASFGKTVGGNRTVTFNYFGAVAGLDSLVWEWGDGARLKVTANYAAAVMHTYFGAAPNFTACVTAYNSCGASNQSCQAIQFPVGIAELSRLSNIVVYPNPAAGELTLEGAEVGTQYAVLSPLGRLMQYGTVNSSHQSISLEGLPIGTYILVLTSKEGICGRIRLVKRS